MLPLAQWYLWAQLLSLPLLPITFSLFPALPDRGYSVSKIFPLLLLTYLLWLGASLEAFSNSRTSLLVILALLYLLAFFLGYRKRRELRSFLSQNWKLVAAMEGMFLLLFLAWAGIRAYNPDILTAEKPMDLAFLNASLRTPSFPLPDPWLSGHPANYYYFGFVIFSVPLKLSGIHPAIGYNLALAYGAALAGMAIAGLVFNIVRSWGGGLARALALGGVGVLFLLFLSNLEGGLEFIYSRGWGGEGFWSWTGIHELGQPPWWWRATRVIATYQQGRALDYTITEFPFFSFLFGDLHPHSMALPFDLLALALGLNLLLSPAEGAWRWLKAHPLSFLALPLAIGASGAINSWNLPALVILGAACFFLRWGWQRDTVILAALTVSGAVLLYLPYYTSLQSAAPVLWPWLGPGTRPFHFLLLWGLWLGCLLPLIVLSFRKVRGWPWLASALLALLPFILWAMLRLALAAVAGETGAGAVLIARRFLESLTVILPLFLTLAALLHLARSRAQERATIFVLLLVSLGLTLVVGSEFFFLRDVFGNRMNTVFKLYYQAWLFLAAAAAAGVYYAWRYWADGLRWLKWAWAVVLVLFLLGAAYYPPAALTSISGRFSARPTLDGLAYYQRQHPAEWEAIEWLRTVKGTPVVVEAAGESYTLYGRVSAFTGLPTVLGWANHETVWRGGPRLLQGRARDIERIYLSPDRAEVTTLLRKYGVRYVYVGSLERARYGAGAGGLLSSFLEVAFENSEVTIFQVPQ